MLATFDKALLRLFVKYITSAALKSILRTPEGGKDTNILTTYLSIIRGETTGRLIMAPAKVVATIARMETVDLSSDPTLPPRAISLG